VFEQAGIGHRGGGSHGTARIFRLGYPDASYVMLAARARDLWRDLESATGLELLLPAGMLSFGEGLDRLAGALQQAGAPGELLPASEAAARFPAIAAGGPCLYEPGACVIAADRVLGALAAAVPDIRVRHRVSQVEPDGDRVTVQAGGARVTARAAVVCAGPWTGQLLAGAVTVPATATLEQVAYVVPAGENGASGETVPAGGDAPAGRPIFIRFGARSPYGLPVPGSGRYKVGLHPSGPTGGAGRVGQVVRPGDGDQTEDPRLTRELMDAVRQHLPGYRPVASERCVYDNTPDEDFVVDRAGPLVIGCGTSGHGFKFGPLLGEWLADLATGQEPAGLRPRFSLARFGCRQPPST
jgi:sarcosine oxidase